ncbi:MAG: tetratricopeptide repeat protein, partial [Methanothrix sp.]
MTEDAAPKALRILVIVSRPLDLPDLPNLADQWALQRGLCRVQAPAYLRMLRPPTVEGLRAEILNGYDIVHFDGHGAFGRRCPNCGGLNGPEQKECERCEARLEDEATRGFFAFEREDGMLTALAAEDLAKIVTSLLESAPKLVFLSACESARGGEASLQNVLLKSGVPSVLGMKESVSLKATMALTTPFYAALGAGMTIDRAFKNALPALKGLENGGKLQKIPVLDGPGKEARILTAKATGKASFEAERLFGLPDFDFVGDYIRADPPRGRKGLLSQAMNALQSGEKLVALTGQGGIGKTVLAAEAACRLAWHYPGGVFWRSAADIKDLDLDKLLNAFDNVFGPQLRTLPLDQKRDTVLNYLRNYDTSSLLVVDNAENINDPNLWRFLEGIPQPSAALVTTRESLPCGGREIRVSDMEGNEAVRFFFQEARKVLPKWGEHLSQLDRESLNEIARVMQGHPLAIKVTAALAGVMSISSIRDELRKNPPQKVSDKFDVSFNSLSQSLKDLFCRLAVFSGSVDDSAIRQICFEDEQQKESNWESDLGELVRRSFLDRVSIVAIDKKGNEITHYRYKLHPLMRQYATGKAEEEILALLRPRAAEYFLDYAQKFAGNFFMLYLEHDNLLAAMDWSAGKRESYSEEEKKTAQRSILQFMSAMANYLNTLGYWNEYDRRLKQAIEAAEVLNDQEQKALWIHGLGFLSQKKGDYDAARSLHLQSLELNQNLGNKNGVARSLHHLGMLAQATGDLDSARRLFQQSLEIFRELGAKSDMAKPLHHLGILAQATGDYDAARKLYQQSLEIKQELNDKGDIARTLGQMG